MPRPARTAEQRAADGARHRSRVLVGLAACIARQGYAATTIADIARAAGVSKATVYAHFADKHDAFLALYSEASDRVLAGIAATTTEDGFAALPWREQVRRTTAAYLSSMARGEGLTRCLLIEAPAVSPAALRLRREVLDRYVTVMREAAERIAATAPEVRVPADRLLLGVVGGMNEQMLAALEADGPQALPAVTDACVELFTVALTSEDP